MSEKFRKIIHLIIMCMALIAVLVFAILHAMTAMDSKYGTLVMAAYVLMFIWAGCRVIALVKEYRRL